MIPNDDLSRIGICLPENLRMEFDEILRLRNYRSRSEGVRDAIRVYNLHYPWVSDADCLRKGVFTLVYVYTNDELLGCLEEIRDQFRDLVKVSLQTPVTKTRRLEVLLVEGESSRIQALCEILSTCNGLEALKLTASCQAF